MEEKQIQQMICEAFRARQQSYCPYSGFAVGAALLTKDNRIYTGCNIENAADGPSNCAERTAIFKAVSEGVTGFKAIAIVGGKKDLQEGQVEFCSPCGVCRQVMLEFCQKDFKIILAKDRDLYKIYTLDQLTPVSFGADVL